MHILKFSFTANLLCIIQYHPRGLGWLPVLVLPDAKPFDQILSALKFGMKTVLLPLEPRHILHRHTTKAEETAFIRDL